MTSHVACIATASDVVAGDVCDLTVATATISGYRAGEDGAETPEYAMTDNIIFAADLTVATTDEDRNAKAIAEADEVLYRNGWTRSTDWSCADNALYADVIEDPEP